MGQKNSTYLDLAWERFNPLIRRALEHDGFRCAVVQVDHDLDTQDVDIVEVQVLLVDEVSKVLQEQNLEPSRSLLSRLRGWFVEEVVETTQSSSASAELGFGELLKSLLPNLKAELKVNVERRRILREKVSRNLREFVDVVSELVGEAKGLLQQHDFKGLVLIDGIEKADASMMAQPVRRYCLTNPNSGVACPRP
ncbi:MAG: hypothetical protein IPI35_11205 [Deltaproteobacteria bacterium]|nr:hypothetical protein [Deltaproteobacteria bacterium]